MATTNKTVGKTTQPTEAELEKSIVNSGTTKVAKTNFITVGVATESLDGGKILIYLNSGQKLIINKQPSEKHLGYARNHAAEKYVDRRDLQSIYVYSEYTVTLIQEVDYNVDITAQHAQETTQQEPSNIEKQSAAMKETTKKATAKTNKTINKELAKQEREEESNTDSSNSNNKEEQ